MCQGQCTYHGPIENVVSHFSTYGYQCEQYENPTDFVLDISIDASRTPAILMKLTDAYKESTMYADIEQSGRYENSLNVVGNVHRSQSNLKVEAAQSFRTEVFYVSQRALRIAVRNPAMTLAQVVVSIMVGLLVGLIFYDLKRTIDSGVQNRLGGIFFIVVHQIFSTMTAIETLVEERFLFLHVS